MPACHMLVISQPPQSRNVLSNSFLLLKCGTYSQAHPPKTKQITKELHRTALCDRQTKCTHPITTQFPIDQFQCSSMARQWLRCQQHWMVGHHSGQEPGFHNFEGPGFITTRSNFSFWQNRINSICLCRILILPYWWIWYICCSTVQQNAWVSPPAEWVASCEIRGNAGIHCPHWRAK